MNIFDENIADNVQQFPFWSLKDGALFIVIRWDDLQQKDVIHRFVKVPPQDTGKGDYLTNAILIDLPLSNREYHFSAGEIVYSTIDMVNFELF